MMIPQGVWVCVTYPEMLVAHSWCIPNQIHTYTQAVYEIGTTEEQRNDFNRKR